MKDVASKSFQLWAVPVAVLDVLCFQAALGLGYWFWIAFPWHGNYQPFSEFSLILWILPFIAIIVFISVGLYKPEMGMMGVQEQSLIFKAIWIVYFITFAVSFFYRDIHFSRLAIFYSIVMAICLVSLERYFVRRFFEWLHKKGIAVHRALIYGAGYHGQRLARWIEQSPKLGIQVIGFLDDDIERLVKKPESHPWFGGLTELNKHVRQKNISIVFIAHRKLDETKVMEVFKRCRDAGISCWAIPSVYQFYIERVRLTHIGGIPLLGFRQEFGHTYYAAVKRILDVSIALLLIVLLSPVILIIVVSLWVFHGPPLLFKQIRIGQEGKKFTMYKFRTLKSRERSDMISPELRKAGGQGIRGLLGFLRHTGLDEIPQLINVVRGEMSLIGPRPEMPFIVEKYNPLERERLQAKPGITGLWQISAARKKLLIHEDMDYDLYYAEHLNFNLDLAIFVKTIFLMFRRILDGTPRKKETRHEP